MKMPMIRSKGAHKGNPWDSFGDEWGDKFKASICGSDGGETGSDRKWRCFPEVRKAIQSKQFLEHLEKGLKI